MSNSNTNCLAVLFAQRGATIGLHDHHTNTNMYSHAQVFELVEQAHHQRVSAVRCFLERLESEAFILPAVLSRVLAVW